MCSYLTGEGIDYTNPIFRYSNGSTRIAYIWDQTIQTGTAPPGISYGSEYNADQINAALESSNPLSIVPSTDTIGHGTFLAGIAAGSVDPENEFSGAAPEATLLVIKLKPAKEYLRAIYLIPEDADAFQETDIMFAVKYATETARRMSLPVSICIGMGTSLGSHSASSPLAQYLDIVGRGPQISISVAAGNEGNSQHHFEGSVTPETGFASADLRVAENTNGFVMEFWGNSTYNYRMTLQSPTEETVEINTISLHPVQVTAFIFSNTVLTTSNLYVEQQTGRQLIFMHFMNPVAGIWRFHIFNSSNYPATFNMWLPIQAFLSNDTYFLQSSPYTTITNPANTYSVITTTAYNHTNDSLYINSSRGYSASELIKPDIAAPGVNIFGPTLNQSYQVQSGTSIAAAHSAGAAALVLEWGVTNGTYTFINGLTIKHLITKSARRTRSQEYPNRSWGYGILDIYQVFLDLSEQV